MKPALIHKTAPILLTAMLLLSVFPTAGHFHIQGTGNMGEVAIHATSADGAGRQHVHDPFHCTIHLIAASFASIEHPPTDLFPTFATDTVASSDPVASERILLTSTDARGPPAIS